MKDGSQVEAEEGREIGGPGEGELEKCLSGLVMDEMWVDEPRRLGLLPCVIWGSPRGAASRRGGM